MITINLDAIQLVIGLVSIIGTVGFQVGIHWAFKKRVEITLKAHEDKLALLDKHRESTNLVLTSIKVTMETVEKSTSNMDAKLDKMHDRLSD